MEKLISKGQTDKQLQEAENAVNQNGKFRPFDSDGRVLNIYQNDFESGKSWQTESK